MKELTAYDRFLERQRIAEGEKHMTDLQEKAMRVALEALQKIYIAPEHEEYIRVWWPKCEEAIKELRQALSQTEQEPVAKVWLWRNFVNDKPEYWAFDNPYPVNIDNDDPQTIGSPCGYALLKPSRDGSRGRKEDEVLREIKGALAREQTQRQARKTEQPEQEPVARVDYGRKGNIAWLYGPVEPDGTLLYTAPPKREWVGLTKADIKEGADLSRLYPDQFEPVARWAEAKLKEKNT